jgi:hypothetical protein
VRQAEPSAEPSPHDLAGNQAETLRRQPYAASLVNPYTRSSTDRLNDSFSTNCLYTSVSSLSSSCITFASA